MTHSKPTPWIAAVLALILTPLAMLYVQRPRLALAYFLAATLVALLTFFSMWAFGSQEVTLLFSVAGWVIAIGCAIHAFQIAKGTQPGERKWYSRWYALAGIPLSVFAVVFLARSFMYEPFRIPSHSMHPTIPKGSIVLVSKAGFGHYGTYGIRLWQGDVTATIARGDIVVHRVPVNPPVNYISRIVALPGDHIQYADHRLTINGKLAPLQLGDKDEDYQYAVERIDDQDVTIAFIPGRMSEDFDQVVPPDQYAVFGDSRDNARDSRYIGLVPRQNIVGRLAKILSPVEW